MALLVIALGSMGSTPAAAGVAFGVRGGYANVDGDAFVGSGKIGGTPLVGLQAILPLVPLVSLVVAGEQRTKSLDFANATFGDIHARGRAKWTDQALFAAARIRAPGVTGVYGGAGVGMHRQKADLSGVVELTVVPKADLERVGRVGGARRSGAASAGSPLDDAISRAEKEATDLSWHAFAGVEFGIPVVPIAAFAEGRIDDIQGSAPHSIAAYAGINLKLP